MGDSCCVCVVNLKVKVEVKGSSVEFAAKLGLNNPPMKWYENRQVNIGLART